MKKILCNNHGKVLLKHKKKKKINRYLLIYRFYIIKPICDILIMYI